MVTCGGVASVLALASWGGVIVFRLFEGTSDPFTYHRVSGQVVYDDGSLIPAGDLMLTFVPMVGTAVGARHPRPGYATVMVKTGDFTCASTRRHGDGLVAGRHKVLVTGPNRLPLAKEVLSADYAAYDTTPLEVDTRTQRFDLVVKRPAPKNNPKAGKQLR
jgi:hypothetical protein